MTNNFVIYVDFDSTLYDTGAFANHLWTLIATEAGLTIQQVKADSASYFFHPSLGGYEYDGHIARYGLSPEKMWLKLDSITDQVNLLYADSLEFIRSLRESHFDPKILTFGEERFQMAKINPMLKYLTVDDHPNSIEVIVVDQKKNQHISKLHAGQKGVLIDDKPDQELPTGFTEIHINRNLSIGHPIVGRGVVVVSNLMQAREVIESLTAS